MFEVCWSVNASEPPAMSTPIHRGCIVTSAAVPTVASAARESFGELGLMVWKRAGSKMLEPVLVLEHCLTAFCSSGVYAQHAVTHLLTVARRQLQ